MDEIDQCIRRSASHPRCDTCPDGVAIEMSHDYRRSTASQARAERRKLAGPRPWPVSDDEPGGVLVGENPQAIESRGI
jgi:hypothetical protein